MSGQIPDGQWFAVRTVRGIEVLAYDGGTVAGIRTTELICMLPFGPHFTIYEKHAAMIAAAPAMFAALDRFACAPCEIDVLNPCYANRPTDVVGKHWGGSVACRTCHARGAFNAARGAA